MAQKHVAHYQWQRVCCFTNAYFSKYFMQTFVYCKTVKKEVKAENKHTSNSRIICVYCCLYEYIFTICAIQTVSNACIVYGTVHSFRMFALVECMTHSVWAKFKWNGNELTTPTISNKYYMCACVFYVVTLPHTFIYIHNIQMGSAVVFKMIWNDFSETPKT